MKTATGIYEGNPWDYSNLAIKDANRNTNLSICAKM